MIDALLLLAAAAFILAGGTVGLRLLALARRSRELTDFIVGFALFDLSAITYPLVLLGSLGDLSLAQAKAVLMASSFALALGWASVFVFTLRVFRPGEPWARVAVVAGIAMLVYGLVSGFSYIQTAPDRTAMQSSASPLLWIDIAGNAVYAWTASEGFRCWALARRRLELGLADPLVANRFLLWGWVGVASLLSVTPSLVITLLGGDGSTHVVARLSTALGGLSASVALQLAFLPPAAYRRWIEARAAA
jgi:hypothetical protein